MTETLNASPEPQDWFYTRSGARKGPVTAEAIKQLFETHQIDGSTPLWRAGLADWKPLRETELGTIMLNVPPPVAAASINNAFAWALALWPIPLGMLNQAILIQQSQSFDGAPLLSILTPLISFVVMLTLYLLDWRQLSRAGYNYSFLQKLLWFIVTPVYLFLRARKLHQTPTYGFAWIAAVVLLLLIRS